MKEYVDKLREVAMKIYAADPLSKTKANHEVWSRYAIIAMLSKQTDRDGKYLSLNTIGGYLNKNHSTVHFARLKHKDYMQNDKEYQELYNQFINELHNEKATMAYTID